MSLLHNIKDKSIKEYNFLISKLAEVLKTEINLNKYSNYKSGVSKERIPLNADWVYYRAASMCILTVNTPRTVNFFKKRYASLKNRGVKKDRKYTASGYIIRHILQILENKGLVKSLELKGRYATSALKNIIINCNEAK
jgi:small subunit ribosomal protein S19e